MIFFQNPSDLLKGGILVDPMMSSKQAQKLLRLICMQKDCGDVDVAGKFRKILKRVFIFIKTLENVNRNIVQNWASNLKFGTLF